MTTTSHQERAHMVVTLPPALHRRLKKLAAANHRTDSALAEELIAAFVEQREWIAAVEVGLKEADEGKLVDFGDVKRAWKKKLKRSRAERR